MANNFEISKVPEEIWHLVFSFCYLPTLLNIRLVCKAWNNGSISFLINQLKLYCIDQIHYHADKYYLVRSNRSIIEFDPKKTSFTSKNKLPFEMITSVLPENLNIDETLRSRIKKVEIGEAFTSVLSKQGEVFIWPVQNSEKEAKKLDVPSIADIFDEAGKLHMISTEGKVYLLINENKILLQEKYTSVEKMCMNMFVQKDGMAFHKFSLLGNKINGPIRLLNVISSQTNCQNNK